MKKSRFTEEQVVAIVAEVVRAYGIQLVHSA